MPAMIWTGTVTWAHGRAPAPSCTNEEESTRSWHVGGMYTVVRVESVAVEEGEGGEMCIGGNENVRSVWSHAVEVGSQNGGAGLRDDPTTATEYKTATHTHAEKPLTCSSVM